MEFAGKHKFSVKTGSLVSRDRPTKYCVFLKIFTNFLFPYCFAALSFLTRELGGVFVDCSGCNTEYSEFVQSKLFNKNNITIFYSSLIKKIDFRKRWQMFTNLLDFCQENLIYRKITTPSLSYVHEQCCKPKKVYKRSTL